MMFTIANWCSVVAQGTIQSWVLLGFPSLAIRPMANVGGVSEFLRWSHAEAFSKSVREYSALGLEMSHTVPLVRKVVAV